MRIDLVGTTADFRRFGHPQPLPINHLLCENRRTQGRMGEVGVTPASEPQTELEPGDRVSRLVERFHAFSSNGRREFCLRYFDHPQDGIEQLKANPTWADERDWLTSFLACAPAEQVAIKAAIASEASRQTTNAQPSVEATPEAA
jgi:hypothetical protein